MDDATSETEAGASAATDVEQRLRGDLSAVSELAQELSRLRDGSRAWERGVAGEGDRGPPAYTSGRINADPETVEQGLAKLVLTLIELIRQLLEKQAIRRMEAGSLADDDIERMGETFMKLEQKMEELKLAFGLENEELNLSLGPLGNLLPEE